MRVALGGAMRTLLPGSISLLPLGLVAFGLAAPAKAGDLEVAPLYKAATPVVIPFSWNGFYVGGHVGGHWGSDEISTATDAGLPGFGPAGAASIDALSTTTLHPHRFIGGVQAGYNWSGSGGVLGIEVDASWLGGTATRTLAGIPAISPLDVLTNSTQASFLSTYRLRWGAAFEHALFFVTAGFAIGTLKTTDTMAQVGLPAASTTNTATKAGLAVGGGIDYAFTDNWSAGFEYLYIALQSFDTTIPATPGNSDDITVTHKYSDSIARFVLNYRLGGT